MNALVLLGGQGTRLRPLTAEIPKPMLPIVGRPMIYEIVEWLASHGVTKVVFALGYRSDSFIAAFASGSHAGVEVVTAIEPDPLDTAGAIAYAATVARVLDERLVVVNGDILTDLDLGALVQFHECHAGTATIALTPVEDPSAFGVVPTDGDGRVLAFIEKPDRADAPTNLINAGTYILEPSVLETIPRGVPVSIEREVFPKLVAINELYALASNSYWLDTGTPERYFQAQHDVLTGVRRGVILPDHVLMRPGVFAASDAELNGKICGASFLGSRTRVAQAATVVNSVLSSAVVIEEGARLVNCVVMEGSTIAANALLERCIVGPGVHIGMHAVLRDSIIGARYQLAPHTRVTGGRLAT